MPLTFDPQEECPLAVDRTEMQAVLIVHTRLLYGSLPFRGSTAALEALICWHLATALVIFTLSGLKVTGLRNMSNECLIVL